VVAGPGRHGLEAALASRPLVAVVGCDRLAELPDPPGVPLLAVGDDARPGDLRAAVAAGARGLLTWPDDAADLGGELVRLSAPHRDRPAAAGTVVAVTGVQGGVGTTTVAVHLAGAWARWGNAPVLLIDLAGGLGFRLDLDPDAPGWDVAAAMAEGPDGAIAPGVLAEPWPGLGVLPAPDTPVSGPMPEPDTVRAVLHAARAAGGVTVVDVGLGAGPAGAVATGAADVLLAVARSDSAGARRLLALADAWEAAGNDLGACGLVTVGVTAGAPLALRHVRARLGDRLWAAIPAGAAELAAAGEDGELLLDRPEVPAVQAMLALAHRVVPFAAVVGGDR
jgi:pilus assembly protein CpaE